MKMVLWMVLGGSLCGAAAWAQTDILTGEPVRPRSARTRPEPTIRNAPHAPIQAPRSTQDDPQIDVLIAPQTGQTGRTTPYWR